MSQEISKNFTEALMEHIVEHTMIPKLQVERIVGPILGMFIPDVFSELWKDDVSIVCPEFPLRKGPDTKQSTNIDWLLYASKRDELVFLELKTTDTTYNAVQHGLYDRVIAKIGADDAGFLASDIECIMKASLERGKYGEVLRLFRRNERYGRCKRARVVYLTPGCMRHRMRAEAAEDAEWLSFEDLPDTLGGSAKFAEEWKVVRAHLIQLDSQTRKMRNAAAGQA